MGIFSRVMNIFKSNTNAVLDKVEDPVKLYDMKIRELLETMHKVEGDTADVIASVKKLESDIEEINGQIQSDSELAEAAAKEGNRDDVERILSHKATLTFQKETLEKTLESLNKSAENAKNTYNRMKVTVDEMSRKKYIFQAKMTAAEAQRKINEISSTTAIGETQSIEDEINRRSYAAEAIDELRSMNEGGIDDLVNKYNTSNSDIQTEADELMKKYRNRSNKKG